MRFFHFEALIQLLGLGPDKIRRRALPQCGEFCLKHQAMASANCQLRSTVRNNSEDVQWYHDERGRKHRSTVNIS